MEGEVSYFFKEPPQHPIIPDKTSYKDSQNPRFQGEQMTLFVFQLLIPYIIVLYCGCYIDIYLSIDKE